MTELCDLGVTSPCILSHPLSRQLKIHMCISLCKRFFTVEISQRCLCITYASKYNALSKTINAIPEVMELSVLQINC